MPPKSLIGYIRSLILELYRLPFGVNMQVPADVLKCVVFLCAKQDGLPGGTAFLVGYDLPSGNGNVGYLITAKHSLDKLKDLGNSSVWIRLNVRGGGVAWAEAPLDAWERHPDDSATNAIDVAVLPVDLTTQVDYLAHPLSSSVTPDLIKQHEIGIGDQIIMPGLFVHHSDTESNNPVLRVGNIAAMRGEPVMTELGPMDVYIAETRSVGGLSGSPVFTYLGVTRMIDGEVRNVSGNRPMYFLLGLMHGHWRTRNTPALAVHDEYVNLGLAMVVPIERAIEIIERSERLKRLRRLTEESRSANGLALKATP
jgi:hypothetical protein